MAVLGGTTGVAHTLIFLITLILLDAVLILLNAKIYSQKKWNRGSTSREEQKKINYKCVGPSIICSYIILINIK